MLSALEAHTYVKFVYMAMGVSWSTAHTKLPQSARLHVRLQSGSEFKGEKKAFGERNTGISVFVFFAHELS